jgi:response regulator RpfG family c-di-GMP phosphodiesterase
MNQIKPKKATLVVLSSDQAYITKLKKFLEHEYDIKIEVNANEALHLIKSSYHPQIIAVDQELSIDHQDFLKKVAVAYPPATRVIITPDPKMKEITYIIKSSIALLFLNKNDEFPLVYQSFKIAYDFYKAKANNIKLNKDIKSLNKKISEYEHINQDLFPQMLQIISDMLHFSEANYYVSHSRAIALVSKTIAEKMELNHQEISRIVVASLLFCKILNHLPKKYSGTFPYKLTDDEKSEYFEHFNTHVSKVYKYSEFIEHARILSQVWERNDGSGLPNGIPGNQLQKAPQIIGLAHEYITLTYGMNYNENGELIFDKLDNLSLRKKHDYAIKTLNHKPQRFSYELFSKFVEIIKRRETIVVNPDIMIDMVKIPPEEPIEEMVSEEPDQENSEVSNEEEENFE